MRLLLRRRVRRLTLMVLVCALILTAHWVLSASLLRWGHWTGWGLLALVSLLLLYNARKKLPFIPLLSSAAWLQVHSYVGLASTVLFLVHIGFSVPNGRLEVLLAVLFVIVAGSGIIGLIMTRVLPPRLNSRGENIIYERIPLIRAQLGARAESLALGSIRAGDMISISDLYRKKLLHFFAGPRHFWGHLVGARGPRHALLTEIETLERYVPDDDRDRLAEIAELVRLKDDLDYRYAGLSALKWWLLVHIPLSYGLLIIAIVHMILVLAFSGYGA